MKHYKKQLRSDGSSYSDFTISKVKKMKWITQQVEKTILFKVAASN